MMKTAILVPLVCFFVPGVLSFALPYGYPTLGSSKTRSLPHMKADHVSKKAASVKVMADSSVSIEDKTTLKLLDDALRFNTSSAAELLSEINDMKSNGFPQQDVDIYVNNLLATVDEKSGTFWARFGPLARFSKRARRACLRRVLTLSAPDAEAETDDTDAEQRRRRRCLVVLLRALAETDSFKQSSVPNIRQLERIARQEATAKYQNQDMVYRIPEGLETPTYLVVAARDGYDIRSYETFSICSVAMNKPRLAPNKTDANISNPQLAGAGAFGALAGYLFGKNQESTAMKMTTPVLSEGEGEDRKMSFVLPSIYWNGVDSAPKPLDGSGVVLEKVRGGERAVLMFGGLSSKRDVEARTKQLLDALANDEEWEAPRNATVTLAQYNDPFTPPWKRRNEVSVEVVRHPRYLPGLVDRKTT